jgi:hypothetical protein
MVKKTSLIESLSRSNAITILKELSRDEVLSEKISGRVKELLSDINANEIEEKVFATLNSIQIEELWERSGETYYGYNEPTEVAYEMVEEAIEIPLANMKKYRELGMTNIEEAYCVGIVAGLLRYSSEGSNDFFDAVPDDPFNIASDIIYEWKKDHPEANLDLIQQTVDRFVEGWDVCSPDT